MLKEIQHGPKHLMQFKKFREYWKNHSEISRKAKTFAWEKQFNFLYEIPVKRVCCAAQDLNVHPWSYGKVLLLCFHCIQQYNVYCVLCFYDKPDSKLKHKIKQYAPSMKLQKYQTVSNIQNDL